MKKLPLTLKQESAFKKLTKFIQDKGYPPTNREFQKLLKCASSSVAWEYLDRLEKKGWIKKGDKTREIKLRA